jgi:hypothetical protein
VNKYALAKTERLLRESWAAARSLQNAAIVTSDKMHINNLLGCIEESLTALELAKQNIKANARDKGELRRV